MSAITQLQKDKLIGELYLLIQALETYGLVPDWTNIDPNGVKKAVISTAYADVNTVFGTFCT